MKCRSDTRLTETVRHVIFGLLICLLLPVMLSLFYAERLPDEYRIRRGTELCITSTVPIRAVPVPSAARTARCGSAPQTASLRLLGVFPIKNVRTQPTDPVMLVPSGRPFGVRMLMGGVMVVGFGEVATGKGHCCPAVDAGLSVGDIILKANGTVVHSTEDFRQAAFLIIAGKAVHANQLLPKSFHPVLYQKRGRVRNREKTSEKR